MQQILTRGLSLLSLICIFAQMISSCSSKTGNDTLTLEHAGWPSECSNGYQTGVSAPFCGICDGMFLLAGGANFPDIPAAEGGRKVFYDDIFLLGPEGWVCAGTLPFPMAYGGCLRVGDRLVAVGGSDGTSPSADVFSFVCYDGQVVTEAMTPLPVGIEQAGYAVSDSSVFVAGGMTADGVNMSIYKGEVSGGDVEWSIFGVLPEPLVQPVAFFAEGWLYVWGGFDPVSKTVSSGGWKLQANGTGWIPVSGVSDTETLTGSSAAVLPDGRMAVIGGVDFEVFSRGLIAEGDEKQEYMTMCPEDYRFSRTLRIFDHRTESWISAGEDKALALAGAGVAADNESIHIAGGEIKPGVRTPDAWKLELSIK